MVGASSVIRDKAETLNAITSAAWTLVVIGVVAYAARAEIKRAIGAQVKRIEAYRADLDARARSVERRRDFARWNRDRLISEENMEAL